MSDPNSYVPEDYNPCWPWPELHLPTSYLELEKTAAPGYEESQKNGGLRKDAVQFMERFSAAVPGGTFDTFIPYLAMNYFDHFFSRFPVPEVVKNEARDSGLFYMACLSIATKMRKNNNMMEILKKYFEINHYSDGEVLQMETVIKGGLPDIRYITPFCFLRYLLSLIPMVTYSDISYINWLIIQSQGDISFTAYKPSRIAAGALLPSAVIVLELQVYRRIKQAFIDIGMEEKQLDELQVKFHELAVWNNTEVTRVVALNRVLNIKLDQPFIQQIPDDTERRRIEELVRTWKDAAGAASKVKARVSGFSKAVKARVSGFSKAVKAHVSGFSKAVKAPKAALALDDKKEHDKLEVSFPLMWTAVEEKGRNQQSSK